MEELCAPQGFYASQTAACLAVRAAGHTPVPVHLGRTCTTSGVPNRWRVFSEIIGLYFSFIVFNSDFIVVSSAETVFFYCLSLSNVHHQLRAVEPGAGGRSSKQDKGNLGRNPRTNSLGGVGPTLLSIRLGTETSLQILSWGCRSRPLRTLGWFGRFSPSGCSHLGITVLFQCSNGNFLYLS